MRPDWMIRIDMMNFFDMKSELRARTSKGLLQDKIYKGVFASTLENEFVSGEIQRAIKTGLICVEKIRKIPGKPTMSNVYLWMEKECAQPTGYKRWVAAAKSWLVDRGILR